MLPAGLRAEAARIAREINPFNAPDGARVEELFGDDERLAVDITRYWGKGPLRLTVKFLDAPSATLRTRILGHLNAWNHRADVKFVASAVDPQVRIARFTAKAAPGMEGYWSYLGTDILTAPADEPTMNLEGFTMKTAETEFRRVVRHEAGHTLGFPHEHLRRAIIARLDRARTITYFMQTEGWSRQDVIDQVLTPLEESSLLATPDAEEDSIMCYDAPAAITRDGQPIAGGTDITASDHAFAGAVYPKKPAQKAPAAAGPAMHVLLIGIDAYAGSPLTGCVNDVDAIQDLLIRRLGVPPGAITRLVAPRDGSPHSTAVPDTRPTRANLLRALEALDSDAVRPGDRVFIYYSGHGTAVRCREVEGRSFTREALLPVDHHAVAAEQYLFDWELSALVRAISARTPAVTVVLDCCCAAGTVRGAPEVKTRDRFVRSTGTYMLPAGTEVPEAKRGRGLAAGLCAAGGHAVVVAACLADERARESQDSDGRCHGELTRAFIGELARFADAELSELRWGGIWRGVLAAVNRRNVRQNPWISSSDIRAVFGGPPEDGDAGYGIRLDGAGYRLDVGTLSGVTKGAEIGVYRATPAKFPLVGSPADRAVRLGVLQVVAADLASAHAVALPLAQLPALPDGARGRLIRAGRAARMRVAVTPREPALEARLAASGLLEVVAAGTGAELVLVRRRDGDWALTDEVHGTGEPPGEPALPFAPAHDLDIVLACVEHYYHFTAPLRLARGCRDLPHGLQVRLLECDADEPVPASRAQDPGLPELPPGQGAQYELRVDATSYCLDVVNTTGVRLYVSVVVCESEGRVTVLPGREVLAAGERHVFWHPNGLGVAFKPTLGAELAVGVERFVAVGTTDARATLDHLQLGESMVEVVRGVTRGFAAGNGGPSQQWTATIASARVIR